MGGSLYAILHTLSDVVYSMFYDMKRSTFARHVTVLASGTALAQAIPIAITPVLTRLYAPSEFGLLALYMSCVAVGSVIATARYELAITLPASDEDAAHVVSMTLKLCGMISVLLYLPVVLGGDKIAQMLGNPELASWFYLLPISVLATGVFNVFQYWCNRTSQYRRMSANRIQNAGFVALISVALGLGRVNGGMILGGMSGQILSSFIIWRGVMQRNRELFAALGMRREIMLAKYYINHPKHVAPAQLLGVVAQQVPIFLISSHYSMATVGFFSMAYKLVSLPSGLIANAIGDVYRQKISVAYNERGEFREIFVKTLTRTVLLAAPPYLIVYLSSPFLFQLLFGESWRVAGEYAQILVLASFFQFVFTPVDKGALIVGATKYIFVWHMLRLLALVVLLVLTAHLSLSVEAVLWFFVSINISLYLLDGVMEFKYAAGKHA